MSAAGLPAEQRSRAYLLCLGRSWSKVCVDVALNGVELVNSSSTLNRLKHGQGTSSSAEDHGCLTFN
jgi:hypothetical protein